MPVSVVVGGQFGSEGKGKSALEIVRRDRTVAAAIRVGGTNSGHTVIGADGRRYALRQLPAAAADRSVKVICQWAVTSILVCSERRFGSSS